MYMALSVLLWVTTKFSLFGRGTEKKTLAAASPQGFYNPGLISHVPGEKLEMGSRKLDQREDVFYWYFLKGKYQGNILWNVFIHQ